MELGTENMGKKKAIIIFIALFFLIIFLTVYVILSINKQRETVLVTQAPLVDTSSQEVSTLPEQEKINEEPINAKCHVVNGLPDLSCTPGAIDSRVTQENIKETICKSGYTKTVRPPVAVTSKIKEETMKDYGFIDSPKNYELDHLISLELGGSPDDVKNLFPEPYNIEWGATKKDSVENFLHAQVCSGIITLIEAQREIVDNWVLVYQTSIAK